MDISQRIDVAADAIRSIHSRLVELNFRFTQPAKSLPGVESETEQAIERIEREVGVLPMAIKLFWRKIGGVDFRGDHPGWRRTQYTDALLVYPPSEAISELEDFLSDREERLRRNFPYMIPIAPDVYIKENVSGGMWYNLSVPAVADDPPLNAESHETTFCNYLDIAIKWGGFPGLESDPACNWPITQLQSGRGGR
jgi:hypothetical protein